MAALHVSYPSSSREADDTQKTEAPRQSTRGNSLRDSIWAVKERAENVSVASESPPPRTRAAVAARSLSASMWATPSQDKKG